MSGTSISPLRVLIVAFTVLLSGCQSDRIVQAEPCELVDFQPTLSVSGLTADRLVPVLEDAARRVGPVLSNGGADPWLGEAIWMVSTEAAEGDPEFICRTFNVAAATFDEYAASAPDASLPDVGAMRLALALAHGWISAER